MDGASAEGANERTSPACVLTASLLTLRTMRTLRTMAQAACLLGRDGASAPAPASPLDGADQHLQVMELRQSALAAQLQSRARELDALQDLSVGLARGNGIPELVMQTLDALHRAMNGQVSASVWAREGLEPGRPVVLLGWLSQDPALAALRPADLCDLRLACACLPHYEQIEAQGLPVIDNQPEPVLPNPPWVMVTGDARTSALYRDTRAWMALPLTVGERLLGVLRIDHREPGYFDAERAKLLQAVASQTALALGQARAQTRDGGMPVLAGRSKLASELHDAASQTLFAANLLAGTLARDPGMDPTKRQTAMTLERLHRSALAQLGMLKFESRPEVMRRAGLDELLQLAVEALGGRSDIETSLQLEPGDGPPPAQRVQLYLLAQQALSHIAHHSGARRVQVAWTQPNPGFGRLRISDDGLGLDLDTERPGHFGLVSMRRQAEELGARLSVANRPGEGTHIELELSWEARQDHVQ